MLGEEGPNKKTGVGDSGKPGGGGGMGIQDIRVMCP